MTDIDEIRTALSDALRLPGEIHPRPGAATTIRARARSRRRVTVVTFAVAVPACLALVALLVGTNDPSARSVSPPAGHVSATPSTPATEVSLPPGPRTLATSIEIRPVLRSYINCATLTGTVPAVKGRACYRLGPAALVIRRVREMSLGMEQVATGTASAVMELNMRLTAHDTTAFSTLTAASLHQQVAFVVAGKVWTAPSIEGHITDGYIQIPVDAGAPARALVSELTG
jgi:hypothetical protein